PVKVVAEAADLVVQQPKSLKNEAAFSALADLAPDLIIVAAFGQILRQNVLQMPQHGCLNVHASLLPRWRGAAPIAAAIRAGDVETGVTIMQMDEGLDTGPMLTKRAIPIRPDHTTASLTTDLAEVGAALLIDTLPGWLAGEITPQPQDETLATLAPRLQKQEGAIDWSQTAAAIERQVRAFHPWPGTFTEGPRGQFKILAVEVAPNVSAPDWAGPGTIFKDQRRVCVATGEGALRLVTVQPAGKTPMAAEAMLNGQPELWGCRLGQAG
ncbi:MAG: methionyl-tRNA formyltransferase, partial [Anaerolineae bacterium]|nr:methionyl-tRNA formyltransferase [Anaerolineae bacterium]